VIISAAEEPLAKQTSDTLDFVAIPISTAGYLYARGLRETETIGIPEIDNQGDSASL